MSKINFIFSDWYRSRPKPRDKKHPTWQKKNKVSRKQRKMQRGKK